MPVAGVQPLTLPSGTKQATRPRSAGEPWSGDPPLAWVPAARFRRGRLQAKLTTVGFERRTGLLSDARSPGPPKRGDLRPRLQPSVDPSRSLARSRGRRQRSAALQGGVHRSPGPIVPEADKEELDAPKTRRFARGGCSTLRGPRHAVCFKRKRLRP